jgi:hypothetical protein
VYSALDPRISVGVSIAGATPQSMRLDQLNGDIGDYEQVAQHIYDVVPYDNIIAAAGSVATYMIHNVNDACCFRVDVGSPYGTYLTQAGTLLGKPIGYFIDPDNYDHSMSNNAYANYLKLFLNAKIP